MKLGWCRVAMFIFLGIYLFSGLQLLYLVYFGVGSNHLVSWKYSIYALFCGVYFDNLHYYGSSFNLFIIISCVSILFIEDYALKSGFIFGNYAFNDNFGFRITPRLPFLVIILWQSLLFPSFSLSYYIVNNFVRSVGYSKTILQILLASTLITGFDVISEPIAVLYGHQLWHHTAFVDQKCDSYTPRPDWLYSASVSIDHSSYYYYYGIPLQNFIGWFVTSLFIYILFTVYRSYFKLQYIAKDSHEHVSYLVTIVCTILFYVLHPCHPPLVKRNGCIYLLCIIVLLLGSIYYKKCHHVLKSD